MTYQAMKTLEGKHNKMRILISHYTQKLLNQIMSNYHILVLGVVHARSAHTGLVSDLFIQ
jgi:hypothetical protein